MAWHLGPFSIFLLKLSQLKAKSLSQLCNLLQTRFLSYVQASDLIEILTWDSTLLSILFKHLYLTK